MFYNNMTLFLRRISLNKNKLKSTFKANKKLIPCDNIDKDEQPIWPKIDISDLRSAKHLCFVQHEDNMDSRTFSKLCGID